ncbi:MAG TPA: acetoacetate--CoA ligase [Pirellulales bacterium]|nr:acetoacetate--CoA ligase [Pirellulales bacterium]
MTSARNGISPGEQPDTGSTPELLWQPTADQIARSNMTAFMRFVADRGHPAMSDYPPLYQWSIDNPEAFWAAVWDFCGVVASRRFDSVVEDFDRMPGARWFNGARLNFAENLLRYRDDRPALVAVNDRGGRRELSYQQLALAVGRAARALRALGVAPGDRVVGYLPSIPETVISVLAAASVGAVWSNCSPDFGAQGVLDRFGQIDPKVLIAVDGYIETGRHVDLSPRIEQIRANIASLQHVVMIPNLDPPVLNLDALAGAVAWDDFMSSAPAGPPTFEQLPPDHPFYILYSSGTTGRPKCIVHNTGGVLVKHLLEHILHGNLTRDDRMFYYTSAGWMMWNWLISTLAVGCTVVLYDGAPLAPKVDVLFDLAERERVTVFGTSPKYLSTVEKIHVEPIKTHDLSSLKVVLSTGAPLHGESFDYVYRAIKPDVRLSSIMGGTELCGFFLSDNPIGPVYRGELQCLTLGTKVEVFDEAGRSVVGKPGELVCTAPFPSMPLGFMNDPEAYHRTYFSQFPGVWRHGDVAVLNERGGMVFYGRSDATLNPGGIRIGTAEIYRPVEAVPEVLESIVVGQDWEGDMRVVLFVKLREGLVLDNELRKRIRDEIRRSATVRHVPALVLQVADIPRTRSGKLVELAVRDVIHGRAVRNAEALINPEALELFKNRPELAR